MRRFGSLNHSTCKTVLNLQGAVYLRFRKIAVERVTVSKFRVNNRGSDWFSIGTKCLSSTVFEIFACKYIWVTILTFLGHVTYR